MDVGAVSGRRFVRWDRWLPIAAMVVSSALGLLAWTAAEALRERHSLALDGRLLRLAHSLEQDLREGGPEAAQAVLATALERQEGWVIGLAISGLGAEVGEQGPGPSQDEELFLGPAWHFEGGSPAGHGGPVGRGLGFGGGRRTLTITLAPAALEPPAVSRLLLPASLAAAAILIGLSVLGGRLLVEQQREVRREAERKRQEGLARAGAGLAHQLRTPLATIKGSCQLLLEQSAPETEKRLRTVLEQSVRVDRLLEQLLDFARPPRPEARAVSLASLAPDLAELDPRVQVDLGAELEAWTDPEHLRHVLTNLVMNALAFGPPGSPVEVSGQARKGRIEIEVADRGPGPGQDPEQLFEPYMTSRADGTGLGLPIARALVEANGGSLELAERPGGGTVAVVNLSRAGERG